ncbi:MAG: chromate transporter, partial [Halothiobacillus sp.]|nr:chromate transporter [Halothiobacillus sp.]
QLWRAGGASGVFLAYLCTALGWVDEAHYSRLIALSQFLPGPGSSQVGEQVGREVFLSGYALAQAVPGPMFTFATYLAAHLLPTALFIGALLATLGIFLPGLLLMLWFLSSSSARLQTPKVQGGMTLLNASVVGLLLATLLNPVASSALHSLWDVGIVLVALAAVRRFKLHILWLVLAFALLLPLVRLGF